MREIIKVTDKYGNVKKAKVALRYYDQEQNKYYIIYEHSKKLFAAKYEDIIGTSKLDTNLSQEEIIKLEKILNENGD